MSSNGVTEVKTNGCRTYSFIVTTNSVSSPFGLTDQLAPVPFP
jgi:hypothetical protein